MATLKIPLNKFRSLFFNLSAGAGSQNVYTVRERRATIVIMAQVANNTDYDRTVTFGVRSNMISENGDIVFGPNAVQYNIVKDYWVPAKDARTLISGRLVIQGFDNETILAAESLYVEDTTDYSTLSASTTGLTLTLGLLETVNTD
jgi:hypothetical protein